MTVMMHVFTASYHTAPCGGNLASVPEYLVVLLTGAL